MTSSKTSLTHRSKRFLLTGAALLSLAACSDLSLRNSLRIQFAAEPVSLDPSFAEDGAALRLLANTMEGLVSYDGNGNLQKRIVDTHWASNQGTRYDFTLKKNARWSDGTPVLPEHFVTGLRRALGPNSTSKLAPLLFSIKNAKAFHENKVPAEALGVKAEKDRLVFELEKPTSYFLHALTLPTALPLRQDILNAHEGKWPESAPVTGPYRITRHTQDQKFVLEKNSHYFGKNEGADRIELVIVSDESTALHLFDQGKLDIVNKIPLTEHERLRKSGFLRTSPFLATYFVAFNTQKPPFNHRDWRRAVSGSINKAQIVAVLSAGDLPASSWLPPGLEGHEPFSLQSENDHRLKSIIERINKERKNIPKAITAGFDSGARNQLIMERIQHDLAQKLGLELHLQNMDWKSYVKMLQTDAPALYRFGWQAPFRDPLPHLLAFTSTDPNNYTHWKNSRYDELVAEIASLAPGPERTKKIREADLILTTEEAVVVPIYHYAQSLAVSPRVSGFHISPFGVIRLDEISLKK